ncbi:hypothetical protein E0Z10_g2118 [Xylaria hypoxylon]|uniref:Uncharacterized protein n=1 Tax=Xylaria hypoxylon TaxID=37992 RepID=A0A4Z0Z5G3_9PEZI|nr:hypothetical protein E0Z10_g2118 [Xylaria hypoxylon]
MELSAHQILLGPFGSYACHVSSRQHHPQPAVVPPSLSPLSRHPSTKETLRGADGNFKGLWDTNRSVTTSTDARWFLKEWLPAPKPHDSSQKEAQHEGIVRKQEEGKLTTKHFSGQPELAFPVRQQAKRVRSSDDVDGPGTAALSCKKRRLLRHLVTSRLSRPFSLPATHILIRKSGNNLHRIQRLAALGGRRAAGQLLVRKAAILNRVRIGVRQAARDVARGNALDHGLLLVTTPASSATFPVADVSTIVVPPIWRPHTTSFHPPIDHGLHQHHHYHVQQQQQQHDGMAATNRFDARCANTNAGAIQGGGIYNYNNHNTTAHICANTHSHKETPTEPGHSIPSVVPPTHASNDASDEEDNTAFPAASFRDRYVDLSDDEVYADFSVLFARSPDTEDQYYEEYLDGLDGIPWVV